MIAQLKAELRKMFSIRSTYVYIGLAVIAIILFAFIGNGLKINAGQAHDPTIFSNDITNAINTLSVIPGLVAILLITHEYRYNTILHTLTLSNSRSKVLLAKILVITGFAVVFTVIFAALSPIMSEWGIHLHHLKLVHQVIPYRSLWWRVLLFGWGYTMAGLVFGVLIRNQIGAIVSFFIIPGAFEGLLSLLLKKNTVYLPFTALHTMLGQGVDVTNIALSHFHAALVFLAYLVVAWVVAWILYLRRDAI